MTKITSFAPSNLDNVRAAMAAALANVEKEFGIKLSIGKMTYTADSVSMNVGAMIADTLLDGLDPKYVKEITKYVNTKDLFKAETTVAGGKAIIVGMKPRTSGQQVVVRLASDNSLRIVSTDLARANLTDKSLNGAFGGLRMTPPPFAR